MDDGAGSGAKDGAGPPPGALTSLLRQLADAPETDAGAGWEAVLRPGAVIGRFELVRELGRGGFGVVWEAKDRELGRRVAFKAVRAGGRAAMREERLLREAEAAARLSHVNLVTLFDLGRAEQGPYLVLELLQGETLEARLARGPTSVEEAVRIAREVAAGVAHAHARGVVHRDLKPANVFLCEDGRVKVLDFGLAHAFGQRRQDGGTPAYMAPEQWEGAPEDERTDVFALGVMLYQMVAAELPFRDPGASHLSSGPAPRLDVEALPALGELVGRMLSKRPVARPRDGAAVAAALESIHAELERTPSTTLSRVRTRRAPRRRLVRLAAAGVALALFAGGAAWWRSRARPAPLLAGGEDRHVTGAASGSAAPGPSIAVLPFADLSPDKDQAYFADGIAEEILGALTRVRGLKVVGRTSSFSFKGSGEDLRTIARKLGVVAVLEGSVRKDGDRVRITAQLVKAEDGFYLWSEHYDRELTSIFAVQDEIARAVVARVAPLVAGKPEGTPAPAAATSPEAYARYLAGLQLLRGSTADTARGAAQAFEGALAIEPGYAPAWAGLSSAHYLLSQTAGDGARALMVRALDGAERAIALAPGLAAGYEARSHARLGILDWEGARRDAARALTLDPGSSTAHRRLSLVERLVSGNGARGLDHLMSAMDLDPLSAHGWHQVGVAQRLLGHSGPARDALRRALEIDPNHQGAISEMAMVEFAQGRFEEARSWLLARRGALSPYWAAILEHALGREAATRDAVASAVAAYSERDPLALAEVHAVRGEPDRAFECIERAVAARDPALRYLRVSHPLARLRSDPRWNALLRRLSFPVD